MLLAPSNPVVSIGTILAVPGIAEAVRTTAAPVVGISPIIGGAPVRGHADHCLTAIGVETSAEAVGRHYTSRRVGGLIDGWLIDEQDEAEIPGVAVGKAPLLMTDPEATAKPPKNTAGERADVDALCNRLAELMIANECKPPTITQAWRDAARLMLDRDQRTEEEIHGAIDWCQADEFWRGNVLSLPKLREKFDQLRLQAQRRGLSSNGPRRGDIDWDAAMERAKQIDANGGLR